MKKYSHLLLLLIFLLCTSLSHLPTYNTESKISLYKTYLNYFPIGAAINPDTDLISEDRKLFIAEQYNSITAENQMKPRQIHPKENSWNWEPADRIVQFAKENNMKVRGHVLVWHQNIPSWMIYDNGQLSSKEVLYSKLKQHITTVVKHFQKDVYCWDVVNEAISDNPKEYFKSKDTLFAIAGEEYIEMAFRFARSADPKAQLFYNDYRFSDPVKRGKIFQLLKKLKEKGVPIDGVGIQSHYIPNEVTKEYLQETFDMFASIGLKVQITELDVSVYNYRDKNNLESNKNDSDYTEERQKRQEEMFKMLFEVYRKNKSIISGVTFWGTSDMRKNYRTIRIGKMDYPFLFDEFMKPKKAFYSITSF